VEEEVDILVPTAVNENLLENFCWKLSKASATSF
jgi:hypothetical protein